MKMVLATILERVDALLPSVDARPTRRGITLAPARGLPIVVGARWASAGRSKAA
jgi:cytochrome P450